METSMPSPDDLSDPRPARTRGSSRRLLLVEQTSLPLDLTGLPLRCERVAWDGADLARLRGCAAELIVAVAEMPAARAFRLIDWLRSSPPQTPTVAILPADSPEELLTAAAQTVDDFVLWPVRPGELRQRLARFLPPLPLDDEVDAAAARLSTEMAHHNLIGEDPAFRRLLAEIPVVARREGAVLVTGETGTGKELCARAIHHLSPRRNHPFIPVDCAALPDHLIENEVFGHSRGAYTDAGTSQKGLLALAEGGTLFLDEIDSLSLSAQSKFLRFLQERSFRPLGSEQFQRADVKVVAATNRDLEACVRERTFRSDLFYRLSTFRLHMTPLRERPADVPVLARHFLETLSRRGGERRSFSESALRRLSSHSWPGNVRELLNVVERTLAFSGEPRIVPSDLALPGQADAVETSGDPARSFQEARAHAIENFERSYVRELLERQGGNVTQAARLAGKERRAFGRLVKKYGLR
jgi:DNA-binding NtrC family response regulator